MKRQSVFVRSSVDLGFHIHLGMGPGTCSKLAQYSGLGFGFLTDAHTWVKSLGLLDEYFISCFYTFYLLTDDFT